MKLRALSVFICAAALGVVPQAAQGELFSRRQQGLAATDSSAGVGLFERAVASQFSSVPSYAHSGDGGRSARLTGPAAAYVSLPAGIGAGSGRRGALVALAVGLISVVLGCLALARAKGGIRAGRGGAIAALVAGLTGVVLSALHLARATGGIGTGSGRLGAIVGVFVGLLGMALGGLALVRSRHTTDRLSV